MHNAGWAAALALALAAAPTLAAAPASTSTPPPQPPQPQAELGIALISTEVPDYRGSDHYSLRVLPLPYLVYRSEHVQITRSGLRAKIFSLERLSATVSAAASLPGSRNVAGREGMPAIDPTFEIGPALDWQVYESDDDRFHTRLLVPLRAVVALHGLEMHGVGWVAVPYLQNSLFQTGNGWDLSHAFSFGPVFASTRYHDYYYEVAPQFATADRPAYDARGGYSGLRVTASSALHRGAWRVALFVNYDWLDGAVIDDSPLVKTRSAVTGGVYITCRLFSSRVLRSVEDEGP